MIVDPIKKSTSQVLMGGVVSQLVVAPFLVAPLERVKVLLQVNPHSEPDIDI